MNKQILTQLGIGVLMGFVFFGYAQYSNNTSLSGWFDSLDKAGDAVEDSADSIMSNRALDYSDVFSTIRSYAPTNLFSMVYYKMYEGPKENAMEKVAKKYGLTKQEAKLAVGGSISVLLKNKGTAPVNFTQKQAIDMVNAVQGDFADYKSTFEIQQELDMAITSSELFSNGILTDSSFDLIHDLNIIEELLFKDVSPTQLSGEIFDDANKNKKDDLPFTAKEEKENEDAIDKLINEEPVENDDKPKNGDPTYGEVETLENGICSPANETGSIFDTYDDSIFGNNFGGSNGDGFQGTNEDHSSNGGGNNGPTKYEYKPYVTPDKESHFLEYCMGGEENSDEDSFAKSSVSAEICVTIDFIIGKQSLLIIPGKSCIECALKDTNAYFEKMLSHSLMPNKLTGNLGENAKCKTPYKNELPLDMNFITIPVPIKTTPNDDIVTGGNPIDSWNKMMERSGYSEATISQTPNSNSKTETEISNKIMIEKSKTLVEANDKNTKEEERVKKDKKIEAEAEETAKHSENVSIFTKAIYTELDQFHLYIKNELKMLEKVNGQICPSLLSKKSI